MTGAKKRGGDTPKKRGMRLSVKFTAGVMAILLLMTAGSLFVNSRVAERYYLYRQREYVGRIGDRLEAMIRDGTEPEEAVAQLEDRENVLIVYSSRAQEPDELSGELREAFRQKGLGFKKFWLWEQDYKTAVEKGSRFRLYQQDKLNYSILAEYCAIGDNLYAIAAIVPNAANFIKIINGFGLALYSFSVVLSLVLIGFLVHRITRPLKEIEAFTRRLSAQRYEPLRIRTGDELEEVAESFNQMGREIREYQRQLELKNRQMEQLLGDVAHDLKTPISLISMYSSGMRDGLDDGTFLDTIVRQNEKMSRIVESLLNLSRIGQGEEELLAIDLSRRLSQWLGEYQILYRERGLELQQRIEAGIEITGSPKLTEQLFTNLLSNAVKYASGGAVEVLLYREGKDCIFRISNEFENSGLDIGQIWAPFYVGEASRNKALSGTGLGLTIAKKIADQYGWPLTCRLDGRRICFELSLPSVQK